MFQRILVALDSSEVGRAVFEQALHVAEKTHARLMLLHVLSDAEVGYPNPQDIDAHLEQWNAYKQEGLNLLRSHQQSATEAGVETEFLQTPGAAPSMICNFAKHWGADLIVVGQRELSGIQRLIRGSVSNYVIHYAPCSVMTVHAS